MIDPFEGAVEVPNDSHNTSAWNTLPTEVEELPFTVLNLYPPAEETM